MIADMPHCRLAVGRRMRTMVGTMIRFSLFRVPVHIHLLFWVAALVWWLALTSGYPHFIGSLFFVVALLVSLLTHEMGHALVGRRWCGRRIEICLSWLGSSCYEEESDCAVEKHGAAVLLAGPLAGLLLPLLMYIGLIIVMPDIEQGRRLWVSMLRGQLPMEYAAHCPPMLMLLGIYILQISVWWSALNLLPIFPMDGGLLLHARMGEGCGAHIISMVITCLLSLGFFALGIWALALLMLAFAYYNYRCLLMHLE